jgi:hypothetical protein
LHGSNIVWLNTGDLHDIEADGVKATFVWDSNASVGGSMIKLPSGFDGTIVTDAEEFRAVVIAGDIDYTSTGSDDTKNLAAGSYLESTGQFTHRMANDSGEEATVYIRSSSNYEVR